VRPLLAACWNDPESRPTPVGEVVMGCIGQVGPDAYNAWRVALAAGLPRSTPAYTVPPLGAAVGGTGFQAPIQVRSLFRHRAAPLPPSGANVSAQLSFTTNKDGRHS
jgi:hypothetical protein